MSALLVAVPALPLLAAVLSLVLGCRLRWRGGELVLTAMVVSIAALIALANTHTAVQATWFESGGYHLSAGLELNGLTWLTALVVTVVSFFIALYSTDYMRSEPDRPRYFAELAFFIGAMLTLVLASSLVLLFAAWEAVGIASYMLIGFRREEPRAPGAAAQAFLLTRLGDMGLLLGVLLVLAALRTTDIGALLAAIRQGSLSSPLITTIALLLLLGVIGKSAQLPLARWLPDAMVAPTPVSALIHSATMVAAGVYLVLRVYPLFVAAPTAREVLFWVGATTATCAALIATGEMDLKRVLAWSTSAQLGEMLCVAALGGPLAAMLLLVMHASFKSALFLCAGAVDRYAGTRDLRRLRGLGHVLPVTTLVFVLGALSLVGLQPFLFDSSEDAVVGAAISSRPGAAYWLLGLIVLSGLYIARAGIATFSGAMPASESRPTEATLPMRIAMAALIIPAVLGTWLITIVARELPFRAAPPIPWIWRVAIMVAAIAGLSLGAWHASRHRAASMLGRLPAILSHAVSATTTIPARLSLTLASAVVQVERTLDLAAQGIARVIERLAAESDRLERQNFDLGGRRIGAALASGGGRLRSLESGKLYLYTLALFVGSLAVIAVTLLAGL